jgi:hypothetical protein
MENRIYIGPAGIYLGRNIAEIAYYKPKRNYFFCPTTPKEWSLENPFYKREIAWLIARVLVEGYSYEQINILNYDFNSRKEMSLIFEYIKEENQNSEIMMSLTGIPRKNGLYAKYIIYNNYWLFKLIESHPLSNSIMTKMAKNTPNDYTDIEKYSEEVIIRESGDPNFEFPHIRVDEVLELVRNGKNTTISKDEINKFLGDLQSHKESPLQSKKVKLPDTFKSKIYYFIGLALLENENKLIPRSKIFENVANHLVEDFKQKIEVKLGFIKLRELKEGGASQLINEIQKNKVFTNTCEYFLQQCENSGLIESFIQGKEKVIKVSPFIEILYGVYSDHTLIEKRKKDPKEIILDVLPSDELKEAYKKYCWGMSREKLPAGNLIRGIINIHNLIKNQKKKWNELIKTIDAKVEAGKANVNLEELEKIGLISSQGDSCVLKPLGFIVSAIFSSRVS